MSVRRLAEPSVQPVRFAFTDAYAAEADKWIAKYPEGRQQSAVIPLLMLAQEQEGWVTKAAIESVADRLGMPYIRVLEVATFYTQFQLQPVGTRAHVQVCGTTPCMLRGAEALMEVCRSRIHPEQFHTNADGTLSWEEVECLGACVNAPMVMIFKDTYEDLTPERLAAIIDQFADGRGREVPAGPQNGRAVSAPITGLTSLKEEMTTERRSQLDAAAPTTSADATARPDGGAPKDGAPVPPSNAGKPSSRAVETDASLVTPSPEKTPAAAEPGKTPIAAHDEAAANLAEPAVEGAQKSRRSADKEAGDAAAKAPELLSGEPLGPSGKRPEGEPAAPQGARSPEGGNMTRQGTPADGGTNDGGAQ